MEEEGKMNRYADHREDQGLGDEMDAHDEERIE